MGQQQVHKINGPSRLCARPAPPCWRLRCEPLLQHRTTLHNYNNALIVQATHGLAQRPATTAKVTRNLATGSRGSLTPTRARESNHRSSPCGSNHRQVRFGSKAEKLGMSTACPVASDSGTPI